MTRQIAAHININKDRLIQQVKAIANLAKWLKIMDLIRAVTHYNERGGVNSEKNTHDF